MTSPVALITGGAGHLGSAFSHVLAARGASIIVLDKNIVAGTALVAELAKKHGGKHHFIAADLMQPECFSAIAAEVERVYGKLDYLVNNAAFYDEAPGWGVEFSKEGYEAWLSVLRVNLLAPFFLTQVLAPLLKKSGEAAIVNIGSIYGVSAPDHSLYEGLGMTNPAAYSASKGGLTQLTKWLSTTLAPDIRVNMVSPGGIARGQHPEFVARYNKRTPLGRMAVENDVAGMAAFLLSKEAAYITGQNFIVDGGWTAW